VGRDAPLYGRRDACRYGREVHGQGRPGCCQPAGERLGFQPRIGFEGVAGFVDLGSVRDIAQGEVGEAIAQHSLDFIDLVGVAGRDQETGCHFQGKRNEANRPWAV
jgi:hypothetical protein